MTKKLFIIIDIDNHGKISNFNIENDLSDAQIAHLRLESLSTKNSKCPSCFCDLDYTMLTPLSSENFVVVENSDDISFIIEEEHSYEEFQEEVVGTENEENIASENLILSEISVKTEKKVKNHRKSVKKEEISPKKESNTCPECHKVFRLPSTLRVHIQRCHTEKTFCCHLCGSAFVRNKELQDHLLRHENPKPFECDLCSERYAVKNSLRDHMRACHIQTNESFFCEFCNNSKKYPTEAKLLDHHARVHSGNDRYPCQQCPRRFKYPESLRNHLVRHHTPPSLMKWYTCNECNFRGATLKSLEKHKLVHLDNSEKPFKCSYCSKGFGRRYEWNRHEMIHRAEKPFICGICSHMARTNYLLQKHMRVHQKGPKPYPCSLCEKRYRDRDTYKKHMKLHADQMAAQGEQLNLEESMQHLANVHKTIPIKVKSFPVILSSATDEINGESSLLLTEVQEDIIIETSETAKNEYKVIVSPSS